MKKNIEEFNKFFRIAFTKSGIKIDNNMLMIDDLRQDCYLIYHKIKCNNKETYQSYAIHRLIGAIRDYRRFVLKSRNKTNYVIHIKSMETPVTSNGESNRQTIGDLLPDEDQEINYEAERIAQLVMTNPIFNWKEREFFDLYFIQDITSPKIAKIWNCCQPTISVYKSKVEKKIRSLYNEERH